MNDVMNKAARDLVDANRDEISLTTNNMSATMVISGIGSYSDGELHVDLNIRQQTVCATDLRIFAEMLNKMANAMTDKQIELLQG